mmetsp:Transcript_1030/g.2588  ORF Transcript_1030/g.2588 Transcript_1030/m.2588 type:complete len:480 (-) Transcript_1030:125-1564(-)|eukprot:CAMPEP_0170581486 /NCGR_PEP_ID=MMETSP0224-20130122/7063_1 /TAXON_ID=285029 /ORGANISM="Togula jolla, Strain CCCM 725" /LENGTH=479 /DNA_ID=CAMNT_0010904621 /DNA_START=80 /DNA_END=1519 /DNA_ORIENTATION=+
MNPLRVISICAWVAPLVFASDVDRSQNGILSGYVADWQEAWASSGQLPERGDSLFLVQLRSVAMKTGTIHSVAELQAVEMSLREPVASFRKFLVEASFGSFALVILFCCTVLFFIAGWPKDKVDATHQWLEVVAAFMCIVITFGAYGLIQEYIMTQTYGDDFFPSAAFLMFVNRLFIIIVAFIALIARGETLVPAAVKEAALPAVTNCISSWCQHSSLRYITFPTQTVFKSSKIIPTMLVNSVVNKQGHEWLDYLLAGIVTACVTGFSLSCERKEEGLPSHNTSFGVALMVLFVMCDALTSTSEKRIYNNHPGLTNVQMMLAVALFSFVYATGIVACTVGFVSMAQFFMLHPVALLDVATLAACSTVGQYLTYYIIKRHGPVTLSIMMTVRQVLSVYVSAMIFGHPLSWVANCCAGVAFVTVLSKPLIKGCMNPRSLVPGGILQRSQSKGATAKLPFEAVDKDVVIHAPAPGDTPIRPL